MPAPRSCVVACGRGIGVSIGVWRTSETISPSASWITRLARSATSRSWVIITIVRPSAVQPGEDVEHLLRRGAVEVPGRLVGQHDRRVRDDRPRDRGALLLAARELRRRMQRAVGEPDRRDRLERARPALGAAHARVDQRQLDVPQHRRAGDQVEALEDQADLPVPDVRQLIVVEIADVDPVEQVPAVRRRVEAADQVHQRRLAAARAAHDRQVVAAVDPEIDVAEGVDGDLAQSVDLRDLRQHHQRTGRRGRRAPAGSPAAAEATAAAEERTATAAEAAAPRRPRRWSTSCSSGCRPS